MADNCWLCEQKELDIDILRDEIRLLKCTIASLQSELCEIIRKKSNFVEKTFTITVCDGNITIEPIICEED